MSTQRETRRTHLLLVARTCRSRPSIRRSILVVHQGNPIAEHRLSDLVGRVDSLEDYFIRVATAQAGHDTLNEEGYSTTLHFANHTRVQLRMTAVTAVETNPP